MTDTVVLSADGRIDLSPRLRSALPWPSGTRLVASSDGDSLVLKPVSPGGGTDFLAMMKQAQALAVEAGLTEADITESIKAARLKEVEDLHGIFAGMDAPDKKELRRMFHEDHLN
ncbi:MAG: AbrB/MazE/SpoVT family DNA-binding domain-containing protein [Treponematales bacterium]